MPIGAAAHHSMARQRHLAEDAASTGSKSGESSHCYMLALGSDEGIDIWESHGRFATTPRVSENLLTISPPRP